MIRRSLADLENALEELATDAVDPDAVESVDVREGVTAPFVTFDPAGEGLADVPDGCTSSVDVGRAGATYRTVRWGGST